MNRFKVGIAVVLTAAMAAFGVGCTNPPKSEAEVQALIAGIGNSIAALIIIALCQNGGLCLIPGDPVGAPVPVDPSAAPVQLPATPVEAPVVP